MKNDKIVKEILIHVESAEAKHNHFCDIITDGTLECCQQALKKVRFVNDNSKVTVADELLDEEYLEAMEAYLAGDKQQAINECFDAIAVLVRMVKKIDYEIKKEKITRAAK